MSRGEQLGETTVKGMHSHQRKRRPSSASGLGGWRAQAAVRAVLEGARLRDPAIHARRRTLRSGAGGASTLHICEHYHPTRKFVILTQIHEVFVIHMHADIYV